MTRITRVAMKSARRSNAEGITNFREEAGGERLSRAEFTAMADDA
jgi:hypothetical protein